MRNVRRTIFALAFALAVTMAGAHVTQAALFELPALLTSVGQSTDVAILRVALRTVPVDIDVDETIEAADLGDVRTLLIAVGASSKGLGVAGISTDSELARAQALIDTAKAKGIHIIVLHVGGEARRGTLSDRFIEATVPAADHIVVVASGNQDGLFNKLASADADVAEIDRIPSISAVLTALFGDA